MQNLTRNDLLDILVALDNQACNSDSVAESNKFRALKWKVFAQLVQTEKEAA